MADETIIQIFEGKNVRIVWNEQEEKYYFAVADIVELLTDSADVKQYIKRMRSRDSELNSVWGTICTPHQFVSTDGKNMRKRLIIFNLLKMSKQKNYHKKHQLITEQLKTAN